MTAVSLCVSVYICAQMTGACVQPKHTKNNKLGTFSFKMPQNFFAGWGSCPRPRLGLCPRPRRATALDPWEGSWCTRSHICISSPPHPPYSYFQAPT